MDTEPCPTCNNTLPQDPQAQSQHALLCASFSSSSLPPKPDSPASHILGLLFPASSSSDDNSTPTPTPTWIKLTSSTDDETSITFQSVDVSPVFPPTSSSSPAPEVLYTERNTVRERDTGSMLEIWTPPASDAEEENATIKALATTQGKPGAPFHRWSGPVLALAMSRATGFMVDPGTYRDVTLEDAGDVVDFLLDYENPEHGRRIREALGMLGRGVDGEGGGEAGKVEGGPEEAGQEVDRFEEETVERAGGKQDVVFEVL
ncbi:hypothetical protein GE09DRAFT_1126998 [Coniochaeta sp. 2T2.1]|nr:hypothetical protein GE09DRAFT_1126998 [Coniochaeta sp. 2T2.1]